MGDLAERKEPQAVATTEPRNAVGQMIEVIERVAMNPEVDVEKMKAILDMQERILDRQNQQAYALAMTHAQSEMPAIVQRAENKHTRSHYAKIGAVVAAITPVHTKHGLALSFSEGESDKEGHIRIICDISHESGYFVQRWVDVPIVTTGIDGKTNMTLMHGTGSAFTYGRRYATLLIFNLNTYDDNDGNGPVKEALTPLTEDQRDLILVELDAADEAVPGAKQKFFEWMQESGFDSVAEIYASQFPKYLKAAKEQRKAAEQRAAKGKQA